jgi:hypothetical protein
VLKTDKSIQISKSILLSVTIFCSKEIKGSSTDMFVCVYPRSDRNETPLLNGKCEIFRIWSREPLLISIMHFS